MSNDSIPPLELQASRQQLIERLEKHTTEEVRLSRENSDLREQLVEIRQMRDDAHRALSRANALTDEWADDTTPVTRAEAARLYDSLLDLNGGWVLKDAPAGPQLRLAQREDAAP